MDTYAIHQLVMPLDWICFELIIIAIGVWIIVFRK